MKLYYFAILTLFIVTSSCVSKKKYNNLTYTKETLKNSCDQTQAELARTKLQLADTEKELNQYKTKLITTENNLEHAKSQVKSLDQEKEYFKNTNTNMLDRLADLSVVSKSGAESIRKSMEALSEQNAYIKNLTSTMRRKDSLNLVLVMNLKRSLADVNDEDVTIEVKKGVVYISLSDKLLFKTGSAQIQPEAERVLAKIAKVVNDHNAFDLLVEGHTDNVPIKTDCYTDNWDLSVKRATSVVRLLQTKYAVQPERMTAGGRGEYVPKTPNISEPAKSLNRRTEIILLPKLDEFFELLAPPAEEKR